MTNKEQNIEKLNADQALRIQRSKIYGDGTTSIPQGIIDILFIDGETGKVSKLAGDEQGNGRVLILLPFRTRRNLDKFACYSQPSDWKLKFSKGMMINAVIENGYVKKLIPSYQYMPSAEIITQEEINKAISTTDTELNNSPEPKRDFEKRVEAFELDKSNRQSYVAAGFEEDDNNPF